MKAETGLVREIIRALNMPGMRCTAWRAQAGAVRARGGHLVLGPEGIPDVIGYLQGCGRLFAIEAKITGNRTAKERAAAQAEWRGRLVDAGGVSGVAYTVADAVAIVRGAHAVREMGEALP